MFPEQGAREVGQKYVVTTFDLGVCMKAYPIIWNQPIKFEDHIIMIGTFHVVCVYFKMIGKNSLGGSSPSTDQNPASQLALNRN
jgi:hypothetical protein